MEINKLAQNLNYNQELRLWEPPSSDSKISFPDSGHDIYSEIEETSFWYTHRLKIIENLFSAAKFEGDFVDIGGGTGSIALHLQNIGHSVALLEPFMSGATRAVNRGVKHVICSSLTDSQLHSQTLAGVGMFDVLEHMEDDQAQLQKIHEVLKPRGHFFLTVPAFQWLFSNSDSLSGHYRRYTKGSLGRLLNQSGFEVKFSSYFFMNLVLPIFFLRTLPYSLGFRKNAIDAQTEQTQHGSGQSASPLLKFITWNFNWEVQRVKKLKSIPIGSSLIVWAQKK